MFRPLALIGLAIGLASCGSDEGVAGQHGLESQIERQRVGSASDQWIEMRNLMGEWERTGLIFGYADDYEECLKAVAGLNAANQQRDYRCAPAN